MDNQIEDFKTKSLTGPAATKTTETKKSRHIRWDRLIATVAITAGTAIGLGSIVKQKIADDNLLHEVSNKIYEEIIDPTSFETQPNIYNPIVTVKDYNYKVMAEKIKELGDNELMGVYSVINELGPNYATNLIKNLGYENLEDYYEKNGFKDFKDLKKSVLESLKAKQSNEEFTLSPETYTPNTNEANTENNHSRGGL